MSAKTVGAVSADQYLREIRAASRRVTGNGPDGITARDLARAAGITIGGARSRLLQLELRGLVRVVGTREVRGDYSMVRAKVYHAVKRG